MIDVIFPAHHVRRKSVQLVRRVMETLPAAMAIHFFAEIRGLMLQASVPRLVV